VFVVAWMDDQSIIIIIIIIIIKSFYSCSIISQFASDIIYYL